MNVLDGAAWEFYAVATEVLNRELPEAKTVGLDGVRRMWRSASVDALAVTPR